MERGAAVRRSFYFSFEAEVRGSVSYAINGSQRVPPSRQAPRFSLSVFFSSPAPLHFHSWSSLSWKLSLVPCGCVAGCDVMSVMSLASELGVTVASRLRSLLCRAAVAALWAVRCRSSAPRSGKTGGCYIPVLRIQTLPMILSNIVLQVLLPEQHGDVLYIYFSSSVVVCFSHLGTWLP